MKVAILVAYHASSPFTEIRDSIDPLFASEPTSIEFDLFYVKGNTPSGFVSRISHFIEKNRFQRLGLPLRIVDSILLSRYRFHSPLAKLQGHEINVDCPDELRYLGTKMLSAYEYCVGAGYDYVLKTTTILVIHLNRLEEFLKKIDRKAILYAGNIINENKKPFVSGACILLSRSTLEIILKKKRNIDHSLLDDVALGRFSEIME